MIKFKYPLIKVRCLECRENHLIEMKFIGTEKEQRSTGFEYEHSYRGELRCSHCDEKMKVLTTIYEYPKGMLNYHDTNTQSCTITDKITNDLFVVTSEPKHNISRDKVSLLLEKYLLDDLNDYIIDENYINYYKRNLELSQENENLIREMQGARVHNITSIESKEYNPKLNIRVHITFNDKLYSALAIFDCDVNVIMLYETEEIVEGICVINLPEKEKQMLLSLSL